MTRAVAGSACPAYPDGSVDGRGDGCAARTLAGQHPLLVKGHTLWTRGLSPRPAPRSRPGRVGPGGAPYIWLALAVVGAGLGYLLSVRSAPLPGAEPLTAEDAVDLVALLTFGVLGAELLRRGRATGSRVGADAAGSAASRQLPARRPRRRHDRRPAAYVGRGSPGLDAVGDGVHRLILPARLRPAGTVPHRTAPVPAMALARLGGRGRDHHDGRCRSCSPPATWTTTTRRPARTPWVSTRSAASPTPWR